MEWNQVEFEKGCERFRGRYPGFVSFEQPGERYLREERRYKIELIELYKERVQPHLLGDAEEFLDRYLEVLGSKLNSVGREQNLIDFRRRTTMKNLPRQDRIKFGGLLQDVLRNSEAPEDVADSLEEYTKQASSIRTTDNSSLGSSTMRAFISLLLMLDKPDRFMYLTFSYWQEVGRILVGNQLIDYGVSMDKNEFLRCSEFVEKVRNALDEGGLHPRDMVDVQSFLYVITMPAWNQVNFEHECEKFKARYEGFIDFNNPGDAYTDDVRKFKDELVEIYSKELMPLLDQSGKVFLDKYHEILERKLVANRPSKWEGWRIHQTNTIPDEKKEHLGKLLQQLARDSLTAKGLVSQGRLSKAFDRYGQETLNLLGEGGRMPSKARVHGTLLLMLARPDQFMHAIFVVWNSVGRCLRGESLIKPNAVVDGRLIQSLQELANDVRSALKEEGLRPRDMIDVQSFLWSIHDPTSESKSSTSEILERIQSEGMRIDEVTLKRYINSLDSRGFVILAGPSGTGKTWLTRLYANAIGAKFRIVPVAPNWAANEDLLGYFNPIEGQFHATTFLEFVDQAASAWDQDGVESEEYHLVLDEMNLARIEHYFSLFLSVMEMRRDDEVPTTELTGGRLIRVPPNLKFIGTVNMDETTHGFADKVFDRAQLLELSITFNAAREHLDQRLSNEECRKMLLDLWKAMEPANPVGFRVLDDIVGYIESAEKDHTHWMVALDQQIVSKLLPKLRGIEPEVAEALRNVRKLVGEEYPLARDKAETMWRRYEATNVVSYF